MRSSKIRMTVQILFLLFMTWIGIKHQMLGGGPQGAPAVDALCPFGGMESLHMFLVSGGWLRRVAPSALILLLAVLGMTVITGRTFCGWICPLGTIGELSARLGQKLGIRKSELPPLADSVLRYLKYLILLTIIFFTWRMGTLVWRNYDPWVAYMHLSAGFSEMAEKPWSYVVLFAAVILASFKIERFWCRYLCPLGALLAPLQKISVIRVRRSDEHCVHCHRCGSACPVRLNPESTGKVTSAECISCGRCVESCPKEQALFFGTGSRKLTTLSVGLIGLVIFFGVYGTTKLTGHWKTWASPSSVTLSKDPTEGVFGWMTVEQISETLEIPVEKVILLGKLPADIPVDVPVKEIEGVNDEVMKENLKEGLEDEPGTEKTPPAAPSSPDEIRGSMTMKEISATYDLDGRKIFEKAGWPPDSDQDVQVKVLAKDLDREVQTLRDSIKELLKEK